MRQDLMPDSQGLAQHDAIDAVFDALVGTLEGGPQQARSAHGMRKIQRLLYETTFQTAIGAATATSGA
jgi:hypothetical protein